MSPQREFALYIEDMLQSIERIQEYTEGIDFKDFKRNYMVVDAVVRN